MEKEINGRMLTIPQHVAIILDGNGRWAKKHHMPRNMGHTQGARVVEQICDDAWDIGIKYLTLYAFSTENWNRPNAEVTALMKLLRRYLKNCIERASKNNMRVRVIGDRSRLEEDIVSTIDKLERATAVYTGLNLTIALNYGSRDEISRAVRGIAEDVREGNLKPEEISEEVISGRLDTRDLPDPDLLIRTSGEQRLSNWLLWQLAYTEFCFMDVLWPDFNKEELIRAVEYYNTRERRFGGVRA